MTSTGYTEDALIVQPGITVPKEAVT